MIRAARPEDVDRIAALVHASFDARLHDYMVYAQHGIGHFLHVQIAMPIGGPQRRFLVDADDLGEIDAFAEFQEGADGIDFLPYICVAERARGRGLATALIDHFCRLRTQSTALQLDVFSENHAAIALYRKLGFAQTGGTSWFVRDLPDAQADVPVTTDNAVEAAAMFARYGFCRYAVGWRGEEVSVGRIGARTIRCFRNRDFADDALLGALRGLFPDARRALFICSTDALARPAHAFLFHTSRRLARPSIDRKT